MPVKRQRHSHREQRRKLDPAYQLRLDPIDRKTRWITLLSFARKQGRNLLANVYGDDIGPDSHEWQLARARISRLAGTFKYISLDKMIVRTLGCS